MIPNTYSRMARIGLFLAAALLLAAGLLQQAAAAPAPAGAPPPAGQGGLQATSPTPTPKAPLSHKTFTNLQGPFETPQDVTKACLTCHAEAAQQVMHTTHWTWEFINEATGQTLGKKHIVNNYCLSIQSNEPRCTSCHAGYGWKDNTFDFSVQENVDCLVCHDTTGDYKKFPTGAGLPVSEPKEFPAGSGKIWTPPDLAIIAQNVGFTSRQTCGACHFYGGGGDEVKHGDLDSSLVNATFDLDVHMDAQGLNFSCTTCHAADDHNIPGSRYAMDPNQWKGCETCHGQAPHKFEAINRHTDRLACQTCHIPEYARGGIATKMWWDWSKAGQLNEEGKPIIKKDDKGNVIYDGQKGEFTWEENVRPDYVWFNGVVSYTLLGDVIDPSGVVSLNQFLGDRGEPQARIWPVKAFRGVQPYDAVNKTLVVPHLFGQDDSAFWVSYDWQKAIQFGMETVGLPYSGQYDFIQTRFYWPITHMVAPAEKALTCQSCHVPEGGRLDFIALGYSEEEAARLTNFPPAIDLTSMDAVQNSPTYCGGCHAEVLPPEKIQSMVDDLAAQLAAQQAPGKKQLSPAEIRAMAEKLSSYLAERGGQYELWKDSTHAKKGVGCVSCHKLLGEGEHPAVPFSIEKTAETCGACHLGEYHDWKHSRHASPGEDRNPLTCASCHEPHAQELRLAGNNTTACVNCHHDQTDQLTHSTHAARGLTCLQCHKNNPENTGHSFVVGSQTCILCHGDAIHAGDKIVKLEAAAMEGGQAAAAPAAAPGTETPAATQAAAQGAVIGVPTWLWIVMGIVVGAGGYWVVAGREPGGPSAGRDEETPEDGEPAESSPEDRP